MGIDSLGSYPSWYLIVDLPLTSLHPALTEFRLKCNLSEACSDALRLVHFWTHFDTGVHLAQS